MAIVKDKVYIDIITDAKKATKSLVTYAAAAAAAGVAIKLAVDFVKSSVAAFVVQEQAVTKLKATLVATGGVVGITSYEMIKMASALQGVTKFGDEAIISAQSMLVTFRNIGEDIFPRALEATLDLSEMFGTNLKESSVQLGKALNDPILGISALTRVGVTFSQKQKDLIRGFQESGDIASAQTVILKELENQFGGVARAARDTASGALAALKNAMGDLKESAGADFATGARPLVEWLTEVIQKSADASKAIQSAAQSAKALAAGADISDKPTKQLEAEASAIKENIELRAMLGNISRHEYAQKKEQLALLELELAKRTELDSWLVKNNREGQIAAAAELEKAEKAAAQAALNAKALGLLNEEYEKTPEYIQAANLELIAYIESFENLGPVNEAMRVAVLANLRGQAEVLEEELIPAVRELNSLFEESIDIEAIATGAIAQATEAIEAQAKARADAQRQMIADVTQVGGQVTDIWTGVTAARLQGFENEKHAALEAIEAEIEAAEAAGENTEDLVASKLAMEEDFAARKKQLLREEAIANKASAIFDIGINTASAIVEALPRIGLAIAIGALGAVQAAVVAATPIPSFATGGDFTTSGEQLIRVGDNPSGRERVRIDPDPPLDGGDDTMLHAVFHLDGRVFSDFVTKASRDRRILTSAGSIV